MNAHASAHGGEVNGRPMHPQPLPEQPRRQFSVDEALQRTPLASINPFDPAVIPLPQALPPSLAVNVLSNHERASGKAHLQHLDRNIQHQASSSESHATGQKLEDINFLLTEEPFTQYEFQPLSFPRANANKPVQNTPSNAPSSSRSPAPKLGAFAERLLEGGAFKSSFRYPTPQSRKTSPAHRDPPPQKISRHTSIHLTPQHANAQATSYNARLPVNQAPFTPSRSSSVKSPSGTPIMVKVPPPSRETVHYPPRDPKIDEELLRRIHDTKAKKREESERASEKAEKVLRDVDIDQRERSRAALDSFQQTLGVVLEAEDSLDMEAAASKHAQQHFETTHDGNGFILNNGALSRIDSALAKAISSKQISQVPLDLLVRLQRLCAKVIAVAVDESYAFPDDASEDALQRWTVLVGEAERTMAASRTLLRTMTAGRTDKELFSEENLTQLLANLQHVVEGCVAPVAETKSSSDVGKLISKDQTPTDPLLTVSQRTGRILKLLGDLLVSSELSEMAVTRINSICIRLVFVANAPSDKESILGVQRFETLRRSAMDCLARVFLRAPGQRSSILSEILGSLEKLPVARQSARHFKVIDGKPIQLVSALIMQLIQTTATYIPAKQTRSRFESAQDASDEENDRGSSSEASPTKRKAPRRPQMNGATSTHGIEDATDSLAKVGKPIWANVHHNAGYVVNFLVKRALTSSKSGDEPYRNLLDIFTEDFISVLGHTDWPAAELVLQSLLRSLIGISEDAKSSAPAKNMALDLMGIMGSGIADLKSHLIHLTSSISSSDELHAQEVASLCRDHFDSQGNEAAALSLHGPYRLVTDYLGHRGSEDVQLQNARNYHLLQWSQNLWLRGQSLVAPMIDERDPFVKDQPSNELARWLSTTIQEPGRGRNSDFEQVSTSVARTAYVLLTQQMTFCKAIFRLSNILLRSMSSQHATLRSRGLKSVIQLLEKDPSMLDSNANFVKHIANAATDQSTMVRDSALQLIGRCIALRPHVELDFLDTMLALTSDVTTGIRKRAIRQLKDAYLRNKDDQTRMQIASAFLKRMNDEEESVTDSARQTLEEMWIEPYPAISSNNIPLAVQQDLNRHAAQLVAIAEQSENVLQAFEPFFRALLKSTHKNAATNRGVCRAIACAAFDNFIENDQQRSVDARANILALLSVLTRAQPDLLSIDQLKMLETYTSTLKTGADLRLYKPVAQIYHAAMPCFMATQRDFVNQLQANMVNSLLKIPTSDLMDEVTSCLWAMQPVLRNKSKLFNTAQQVLKMLEQSREADHVRAAKAIKMLGHFGKSWNLDDFAERLRSAYDWWKGEHVSELIVRVLLPSTQSKYSSSIRKGALESIGITCLSWPENYLRKDVLKTLEAALRSGDESLEYTVVCGLRDFFRLCEGQIKPTPQTNGIVENGDSSEKLGTSMVSSDMDKAGTQLAQKFFNDIEEIALRSLSDVGLAATDLICSTNRQGVVHPRQCGYILVVLGTSPNAAIAKAAYNEHMSLNSKHESILEKEYVRAVERAFEYQRDTVKDSAGLIFAPAMSPKLGPFFEVLKSASVGTRKKLFPNLCKRLDVNVNKLESAPKLESHLLFAKFVSQNLAFGSYGRVEEIMSICKTIEDIFSATGNALSQRLEPLLIQESSMMSNLEELGQLAMCAMLLTLLWRTRCHLRSLYTNIPSTSGKQEKHVTKDTTKPPLRSPNGLRLEEAYIKTTEAVGGLVDEATMRDRCKVFLDVLNIDHEAKVGNSSDEMENGREGTPNGDDESARTPSLPPSGASGKAGRKRRRSESVSTAATPTGRKRGRPKLDKRRSSGVKKSANPDEDGWD